MTWTMISANTSHRIEGDTVEITPEAVRILREQGWTHQNDTTGDEQ